VAPKKPKETPTRVRTVRWLDPSVVAAPAQTLSGLDFLQKIAKGDLPPPPIAELLGMRLVSVGPSSATFEFDPAEFMYNPIGSVHGGVVTTLLDSAMGCAIHTTLPAGVAYTTIELKVNFVRPVLDRSGALRAEGKVLHGGPTVATAESRLVDREGTLFAHATSTVLILRGRPST
jgi:uncharacterized protein (TIGR00369 family)